MELFRDDGHLSGDALRRLAGGGLSELERLELSEHLSCCDECLLRYTELLDGGALLEPSPLCRQRLWQRIRRRTLRLLVNRYAAAAAAVALMLAALWGGGISADAVFPTQPAQRPAIAETLHDWPQQLGKSLQEHMDGLNRVFDYFGSGDMTAAINGGK